MVYSYYKIGKVDHFPLCNYSMLVFYFTEYFNIKKDIYIYIE